MNVYFFNADIYCEPCGRSLMASCENVPEDIREDSNHYPHGPIGDGGGEADCPQHCGTCGVFLENPLTRDGVAYVADALSHMPSGRLDEWAEFYKDKLAQLKKESTNAD